MNLREALQALRASWWLPIIGLIVAGALAYGISSLQTPLYTSTTQLFVSAAAATSPADTFQGGWFSEQRAASYARLVAGEELARRVADRLELEMFPSEIQEEITASAVPGTVLIDVNVTDRSAARAQQIAEAIGLEFPTLVDELEAQPAGGALVRVAVADPPELPTTPSSPDTTRNIVLGLAAGALTGALGALARRRLDRTVKDAEEASELAGVPVIGTVLRDEALIKRHTIDRGTASRTAEDYRQLRTNLRFLNVDEPPKVIMVSSAVPAEGKTTVVINLALALAEADQRVTVVEADLRRPKVTKYLGMVGDAGLTNILSGAADIPDVMQTYREGFSVIAAGPIPPNPGELLGSSHMAAVIDKLRGENDVVLVDAAPLLPVADSTALAAITDGVLLSVRYGSTRKDQLAQASAALERVGATRLGVILNIVPPRAELASAYGYGYSYGYDGKHSTS